MVQRSSLTLIGLLTLALGGCGLLPGQEESSVPPEPVVTQPQPAPQTFEQPPVVAPQPTAPAAAPAIIQATNPDQRVRQVQQGRQDPFAIVPVPPIVTAIPGEPTPPGAPRPVPVVPPAPRPAAPAPAARPRSNGTTATRPGTNGTPGSARPGVAAVPTRPATLPTLGALPTLPEPTLAQSVEVTGLVQVGNVAQIILKAPDEPTSRYVSVGQRISNGQVLVKRIEGNNGLAPRIIFEQYGIEVAKPIGPSAPPTAEAGTPAAALPAQEQAPGSPSA